LNPPLLQISGLTVTFVSRSGLGLEAVRGLDLTLDDGELHGIVGESGSGKSVAMMAIMGLLPPSARVTGSVKLRGEELIGRSQRYMRRVRGARIGYVFQDPMTALNPLLTVGAQVAEALTIHDRSLSRAGARARALALLHLVAIPTPERRIDQYPHEFSGGMRQRVSIAIAMANEPELLIADEPTTALDVTIQAQIMELLRQFRQEKGIGLVLVSHDLGVVAGAASRVSIMYAGKVVERGSVDDVLTAPLHPYTRGLLASLPKLDQRVERLTAIAGAPPAIHDRPSGCDFNPRCTHAVEMCRVDAPRLRVFGSAEAACHFAEQINRNLRERAAVDTPGGG
jgi:oligopeptide/dipeptide ABC transporter ATP-binding protein